jgi:GH15 family glucan-1,4-alpha-glucosidase
VTSPAAGAAVSAPAAAAASLDPATEEWPSLYDYGVIGNEWTAALVSRFGSIDWACLPVFDSPSVFARILDRRLGGFHRIAPREPAVSSQSYVPSTNILRTRFQLSEGRTLTVTDFMPVGPHFTRAGSDPRIVRQLQSEGGPVDVATIVDARFDYGRETASWSVEGTSALGRSPTGDTLAVTAPWEWRTEPDGRLTSGGAVDPGASLYAQVHWGALPPSSPSPESLLAVTDAYWRGWASPDAPLHRVAGRWLPWVERSELVLKLLGVGDSGVFVAAPTTSLPEWPGAARNWDYRYVWLRDAAFTAQVFLLLGHTPEARSYVGWALDRAASEGPGGDLQVMYTIDGRRAPAEQELDHLEGYGRSRPVRIGNGAAGQLQLDIYGEVLDSAASLARVDPAFVRDHWSTLEHLANRTADLWTHPDSGIWEFRTAPAHYVHSKLMCWVALDRAIHLAELFGRTEPVDRWRKTAQEIRDAILTRGFDDRLGAFVQAFERPYLDAGVLRVPLTGFLPPDDARVVRTISAVERTLGRGPFVRRYQCDDGLESPEGSFLLCSFWLVECLARSGQTERALERWTGLLDVASPLLLFSEEYDPVARRPLGNYPQAFTHIGLLRAALALGLVVPGG